MKELSLFTGAGGGVWASKLLNHQVIGYVEQNEYCQQVIAARIRDGHFDEAPIFTDVREFLQSGAAEQYRGVAELVSGGIPCQPYSGASRGRSKNDNVWRYTRETIAAVRPKYTFFENVSKSAIELFASDLSEMGFDCKAITLSAKDMGSDHIRRRYWLFAYANSNSELSLPVDAKMAQLSSICSCVWASYPYKSRMDDGVANWRNRIKAIGNGQVPVVAATAFKVLSEAT